ncbi:MAG: type III-B CRISPR-associated protein Cas10/Cmr2 [Fimbriimonadales bacterium]|nr:type III-B CRISPR-associated protein Cas10/Cmr2 [Fimbriimonadales bacterium]
MNRYLFRISFGPVQPFIAASRRTRDLANGSELLVRVGRWIASEAQRRAADLVWIFPHDPQAKAANVLQFVATVEDPRRFAATCRAAAVEGFRQEYDRANLPMPQLAQDQFDAYLQFFAAWEPCREDADYRAANRRVTQKLAARKLLRAFPSAPSHPGEKVDGRVQFPPKSPLLPSLDCVLPLTNLVVSESVQERHLVGAYEFLDGISLLKRRMRTKDAFPSTLTVCAYGAVSQLQDEAAMARFRQLVQQALREDWDEDPGDLLYRRDEEADGDPCRRPAPKEIHDEVNALRSRLKAEGVGLRAYYAVLHADGDGMGSRLSELDTLEHHRQFSRTLATEFADRVPEIVDRHHGSCVYAGGDDVLALVPVQTVLRCAQELNRLFCEKIQGCTLSVGVAIVHAQHSLQHAVGLSRELERMAKAQQGKNSLAVGVFPRNGGETRVVFRFGEQQDSPFNLDRFLEHADRWRDGVPRSLPFDLRDEAQRLPPSSLPWVVPGAYQRIVKRKRLEGLHAQFPPGWVDSREQLLRYADHLAVAHFLTRGGRS